MKSKMNLPNKLSVLRLCLVPIILIVGLLTPKFSNDAPSVAFYISSAVCAVLFIAASITDMLDGKIARKRGLITDFGKFIDPIADKFMVIGALFVLLYKFAELEYMMIVLIITLTIIVFRELAVTSIRLVASKSADVVVAANILGKVKTVMQIVAISSLFLEPVLQWAFKLTVEATGGSLANWRYDILPISWISITLSVVMTVWSGIGYIKDCWKYLDPEK